MENNIKTNEEKYTWVDLGELNPNNTEMTKANPELIQIIENFRSSIGRLEELTSGINGKLQLLSIYEEPMPEEEKGIREACLTSDLNNLNLALREQNYKLEICLRHLNTLI